jgi:hypothetical protein
MYGFGGLMSLSQMYDVILNEKDFVLSGAELSVPGLKRYDSILLQN